MEELCTDCLPALHNARSTTVNAYRYSLARLRERHGDLVAEKRTRPDLDRLLTTLRDGGTTTAKGGTRRPWLPRSLNKAVDAWRAVLAYGVERRELSHNVAASMKKAPRVHQEMATYTPDEIRRVLRAARKDRSGHLWYLALSAYAEVRLQGCGGQISTPTLGRSALSATGCRPARATSSRTTRKRFRHVGYCRSTRS